MKNEIQIEISYYRILKNFNLSRAALKDCKLYELKTKDEIDGLFDIISTCYYKNITGDFYEDVKLKRQAKRINVIEIKYFFTLDKKDAYILTINIEYEEIKEVENKENSIIQQTVFKDYSVDENKTEEANEEKKEPAILIDDEKYSNMENKYQEWRAEIYKNCQTPIDFFERLYRGRFWSSFSGQMKVYVNNKYILSNSASFVGITQEQYNEVEIQIKSGKPIFLIDYNVDIFDEEISKYKKEFKGSFKEFIFKRLSNYSDMTRCLSLNLLKEKFNKN